MHTFIPKSAVNLFGLILLFLLFNEGGLNNAQSSILEIAIGVNAIAVEWSPDGSLIAVGTENGVQIYTSELQLVSTLPNYTQQVVSLSWSPDSQRLSGVGYPYNYDKVFLYVPVITSSLLIWQRGTGDIFVLQKKVDYPEQPNIVAVKWSPDGTQLATRISEYLPRTDTAFGSIEIWNTSTWEIQSNLQDTYREMYADIAWNPDGSLLASGGESWCYEPRPCNNINGGESFIGNVAFIVNGSTGGLVFYNHPGGQVYGLAWSTTNQIALAADSLRIYDANLENIIRETTNYSQYGVLWMPNQTELLLWSLHGEIDIVGSVSFVSRFNLVVPDFKALSTSPDGNNLAVLTSTHLSIYDISLPEISSFTLLDIASNPITGYDPLAAGAQLDLVAMPTPPFTIRANTAPSTVGSVVFNLNGTLQTDDTAPYDFTNWTPAVGSYTLTATPYSGAGGTGTPGTPLTIHFTVTGSRILYEHNDHIYSINPDGSDRQDLGAGYAPAWSPDGTKIAFHAHGSGGREIYLMNADGSNRVRLTNNNIDDRNPAFSPDGSRIVYGSVITGADWELWVMNADGTNKVQITNNSIDDKDPQWSSTDWIVFTANPGDYAQLYKMRPDGSQRTRLINSTVSTTSPEWSPDGSYIVYTRIGGTYTDIYRINADGTNALRLTTDPAVDQNPCFSPDGQQILFSSLRNPGSFNYFELYSITVDGSNETRLTTTGSWDEQRCAWGYP